jgi:hypothetical protein
MAKIKIPETEKIRMLKSTGMTEKMAVMKMADMKRKKLPKEKSPSVVDAPLNREDYPYGLRIELDHDGMKKLGLKKMPKVGSKHQMRIHAKVTHASERSDEHDKKPRREVSMQITHMAHDGENDSQGNGLEDQ